MGRRSQLFSRDDSGTVMVLGAILLVVLLGFAALAIDIGHLYVVKNELQNAADAGALAGSNDLAPFIINPITNNPNEPPVPDFDSALKTASDATKDNQTDHTLITDPVVDVGYFNLITRELQSSAISPTTLDVPAVRVTVSRAAGQNGGAVLPFVARILGVEFMNVSAQAMAMLSCPSSVPVDPFSP